MACPLGNEWHLSWYYYHEKKCREATNVVFGGLVFLPALVGTERKKQFEWTDSGNGAHLKIYVENIDDEKGHWKWPSIRDKRTRKVTMLFRLCEQINRIRVYFKKQVVLNQLDSFRQFVAKFDSHTCTFLLKWETCWLCAQFFCLFSFFADTELLVFLGRKRRARRHWPVRVPNTSAPDLSWPSLALWLWSKSSLTPLGSSISHREPLTYSPIGNE